MKKHWFTLSLIVCFIPFLNAQNIRQQIESTVGEYFRMVEEKKIEESLDYIYPGLFDHIPRHAMVQALNKVNTDTNSLINFYDPVIIKVSEPEMIDNISYALVLYSMKMSMRLNSNSFNSEPGQEEEASLMVFEMLKEQYGTENVVYDEASNVIEVTVKGSMYAINNPEYNGWKFLEKKENLMPVLEKLIPKKVIKKLR